MKRLSSFVTFMLLIGVTGCGTANTGSQTPPDNAKHITIQNKNTDFAVQDLQNRLDIISDDGKAEKLTTDASAQLSSHKDSVKKPVSIWGDINYLKASDSGITNQSFIRDVDNVTSLYEIADNYHSIDALDYLDRLVAEMNLAANHQSGRYYGLSHIEGHGKEIDSFISE